MTRKILLSAAFLAAIAGAAPALAAGSAKPQIHDAKGDWAVASQDILTGTVTATAKKIQADLTLAAPPATGLRSEYAVFIYVGCTPFILDYVWNGGLPGGAASLQQYACATGDAVNDTVTGQQPVATFPATATNTATGLRIVAAPTKMLHSGIKVGVGAISRAEPVLIIGFDGNSPSIGGDVAYGTGPFILGS